MQRHSHRGKLAQVQHRYGLKDPAAIQRRILFENLLALLKTLSDDSPQNKRLFSRYLEDWHATEKMKAPE